MMAPRNAANQHTSPWTQEKIDFLTENYPVKGKEWCCNELGMKECQVRYKASALGLRATNSESRREAGKKHSEWMKGKRFEMLPETKRLYETGERKKEFSAEFLRNMNLPKEERSKRAKEQILENGHPRGMAGKKHNINTKEIISKKSTEYHKSATFDAVSNRSMKMLKTKAERGNLANPRPQASWKAGWREVGGQRCYFRSAWEANYARYLQFLLENNHINGWEHETETFWFEKIKRGCRSYLPDFRVTEANGEIVYHEVKGWMDDRSKTKIKRMGIYHPTVKLVVVDTKLYKEIQKKLSAVINGWER